MKYIENLIKRFECLIIGHKEMYRLAFAVPFAPQKTLICQCLRCGKIISSVRYDKDLPK